MTHAERAKRAEKVERILGQIKIDEDCKWAKKKLKGKDPGPILEQRLVDLGNSIDSELAQDLVGNVVEWAKKGDPRQAQT